MARDRVVRGCRIWLTAIAARQPTTVDTALDVADVRLSAPKGELVVRAGKGRGGGKRRILPVHPTLQNQTLQNQLKNQLTARAARAVITQIGELAGLGDDPHHRFGPHLPETGRAKPSREMTLHLAEHLDVPLRARNELLLAAGFAPAYVEQGLENPQMAPLRDAVDLMLTG